jgi:hypothetical protein
VDLGERGIGFAEHQPFSFPVLTIVVRSAVIRNIGRPEIQPHHVSSEPPLLHLQQICSKLSRES